jgi:hypothetical protein
VLRCRHDTFPLRKARQREPAGHPLAVQGPSRKASLRGPEAIRRLVELGLKAKK